MDATAPDPDEDLPRICPAGSAACAWRDRQARAAAARHGMSRRAVLQAGAALELLCCLRGALGHTLVFAREQGVPEACRRCFRHPAPG